MTHGRDTFLPIRELLARAIVYSSTVEQRLGRLRGTTAESRTALLQSAYKEEQTKLTTSFERYANEATPATLDTFAQYSPTLPDPLPEPGSPLTPISLTQWMLDVNGPLIGLFSDAGEPTHAHEVLDNLAALVRHHEMRIVQAADGANDL